MAWGSIQEASTLYSLMHAFPKSQLLECGLFQIDPTSLPKAWGFKQGELPALGASPDGMFIHPSQPDMDSNILGTEVGRIWRPSPATGSEDVLPAQLVSPVEAAMCTALLGPADQ